MAGYVAKRHLRFGDRIIPPGDPVPIEDGRDYALMEQVGDVAFVADQPKAEPKARKPKAEPKGADTDE